MLLLLLSLLINPSAHAGGTGPEFLSEVLTVYREESARLSTRVREVGEQAVLEGLAKDALEYQHAGLGRAKVVSIAGELSIRVVHQASGIAFVFLDQDKLSPEEPKLRTYLANQRMDAGHREVRPRSGRNVVYVWMKESEVGRVDSLPRHKTLSGDWWRDYGLATLRKPEAGDLVLGTACASLYGGLAVCVAGAQHLLSGTPMNWEPGIFTAAYSFIQGAFVKTLSSHTLRGTPGMQRLRAGIQVLAFNYSLSILSQGAAHTLNFFDPAGLLAQLQVWGNVAVSSTISVDWREPLALRSRMGITSEPVKIPLPDGKAILMDRYAVERNFIGVFTFPASILDLTGVSPLPLGKMLLLGSVPLLRRFTLWYSQRIGSPEAEVYRERWESWLPVRMWKGLKEAMSTWSVAPDKCGRFLKLDATIPGSRGE